MCTPNSGHLLRSLPQILTYSITGCQRGYIVYTALSSRTIVCVCCFNFALVSFSTTSRLCFVTWHTHTTLALLPCYSMAPEEAHFLDISLAGDVFLFPGQFVPWVYFVDTRFSGSGTPSPSPGLPCYGPFSLGQGTLLLPQASSFLGHPWAGDSFPAGVPSSPLLALVHRVLGRAPPSGSATFPQVGGLFSFPGSPLPRVFISPCLVSFIPRVPSLSLVALSPGLRRPFPRLNVPFPHRVCSPWPPNSPSPVSHSIFGWVVSLHALSFFPGSPSSWCSHRVEFVSRVAFLHPG